MEYDNNVPGSQMLWNSCVVERDTLNVLTYLCKAVNKTSLSVYCQHFTCCCFFYLAFRFFRCMHVVDLCWCLFIDICFSNPLSQALSSSIIIHIIYHLKWILLYTLYFLMIHWNSHAVCHTILILMCLVFALCSFHSALSRFYSRVKTHSLGSLKSLYVQWAGNPQKLHNNITSHPQLNVCTTRQAYAIVSSFQELQIH